MTDEAQAQGLAILRKPFPPEQVHKLPKPYRKDNPKGNCKDCGGWHGLPAAHLDYVGHAELTARLLEADPYWSWEPLAFDERGLPLMERSGQSPVGMWIKLTVCGVTRLGYGTCETGKNEAVKELIGDALRNAGMRFGAALDLWSKSDQALYASDEPAVATNTAPPAVSATAPELKERVRTQVPQSTSLDMSRSMIPLDQVQRQEVLAFMNANKVEVTKVPLELVDEVTDLIEKLRAA